MSENLTNPIETTEEQAPVFCEVCGCLIEGDDHHDIYGGHVCDHCHESGVFRCEHCGKLESDMLSNETYDGYVCESCLDDYYTYCEDCETWHRTCDVYTVNLYMHNERSVCDRCIDSYYRCDDCGEYYSRRYIEILTNDGCICGGCAEDWTTCDECGSLVRRSDAHYIDEDEEEMLCNSCYENGNSPVIHSYSYKPRPIFGTCDDNDGSSSYEGEALTFGVELEVDDGRNRTAAVRSVYENTDRAYCKHDGSLSCDGFEIVTHPGTLEWHMKRFPWKNLCNDVLSYDYRSHDTSDCGLHIHIGVAQLGKTYEERIRVKARLGVLVQRLWQEVSRIARRGGNSYSQKPMVMRRLEKYDEVELTENTSREYTACDAVCNILSCTRYNAVNVENSKTVELRFCRGTLKYTTILASIQFADALCKFAMTHNIVECATATWSDLMSGVTHEDLLAYEAHRFRNWNALSEERDIASFLHSAAGLPSGDVRVGDTVRVATNTSYYMESSHYGVVVANAGHNIAGDLVLVRLAGFTGGHDGCFPDGHFGGGCLWISKGELVVMHRPPECDVDAYVQAAARDIFLHDRVEQLSPDGPEGLYSLRGMAGRVMAINHRFMNCAVVEYDFDFIYGHDCDGSLTSGNGRYMPVQNLFVVEHTNP